MRDQRIARTRTHRTALVARSDMDLDKCRYIVVEGPIGAGKTSLARAARASTSHADTLLEQPEDNPVPRAFLRRHGALRAARRSSRSCSSASISCAGSRSSTCSARPTVADFLLDKDPLFARLNLSDDEYALYEKIYAHLKPQTPTPDLVVYLQAPVDTLIDARAPPRRRASSGRSPTQYLARLADAYARFFYSYDDAPLLIVNSERLNFVDNPAHLELLLARIAGDARRGASSSISARRSA